jgi:hypothetical protein
MRITSTTLRRIIKEELDAVMNEADAFQAAKDEEERAATAASAAAFQASPERAMMAIEDHVKHEVGEEGLYMEYLLDDVDFRKLEAMSDDDPQKFMKLIAARLEELAPGRGVASYVFDDFDLQAELNEEDEDVKRARERGHIGKAFDVRQNKFQLKQDDDATRAMRDRVAKLKARR